MGPVAGSLATTDQNIPVLEPGKTISREIAGGEIHNYAVSMHAGQYAHIAVNQRGIDLVVAVIGQDDKRLEVIDSPNGSWGPEEVSMIASTAERYRLEVRSLEKAAAPGKYEVVLDELRVAQSNDQVRVAAQRAYADGEVLRTEGTAESLRRAIEKYEKAASLRQSIHDRRLEALTLTAIGELYSRLGERRLASDHYNRALPLLQAVGDAGEVAGMLDYIGVNYHWLGEYQKALECFSEEIRLERAVGNRYGEAGALNNAGTTYRYLGDYRTALEYLTRALELRRAVGNSWGQGYTLTNIGLVYRSLGDYQKALDFLTLALPLRRSTGDQRGEGMTLSAIGEVYDSMNEKERALDYFQQALSLHRTVGDRGSEAETLAHIGTVYASFGEKQKAFDYFSLALAIERAINDRVAESQTLYQIARVERDRGNLIEARKQIEAAFEIFDSLQSKVASQELRASYFATLIGSNDLYVDVLMRLHLREPAEGYDGLALRASESARARILLELLRQTSANFLLGVDPALRERERGLRELLDAKVEGQIRLLSRKHTDVDAAVVAGEIEKLRAEYEQVRDQIRSASPRYAALTQPQTLGFEEIQKQVLDGETALLEYSLGDERSYMWVVTSRLIKAVPLPKRTEIEAATRHVYELLTERNRKMKFESAGDRRDRIARADTEFPKAAAVLSQMLLDPVVGELGSKRLLIVADGALQYIPFVALPSPTSPAAYRPLGAVHEVVSLPSASVLAVLRKEIAGRSPTGKILAVLADPVFDKDDERVKRAGRVPAEQSPKAKSSSDNPLVRSAQDMGLEEGGQLRIPRLPFTRREAEAIFSLAPAAKRKELLDFDANRAAATSQELGQYRFVHFATHGFLNSVHPELSGLVFSLVDREGKDQDGFLPALEVYNLKLPVDLVVLSGCRTGLGKDIKGEGLIGLTRGFMYAGAARILVSLWDVDDEATAALMARFYDDMLGRRHLSPAAALQAAQISIAKEERWRSPYYWAAFVLQGEPK